MIVHKYTMTDFKKAVSSINTLFNKNRIMILASRRGLRPQNLGAKVRVKKSTENNDLNLAKRIVGLNSLYK